MLAVPLARISDRGGRRAGLAAGYGVAVLGAVVTVAAAVLSSLPLLLAGLFAFGAATACGLQARYAAADLAPPERRGRDLSLVVWATTVGSVLGPNLAGPGAESGARPGAAGPGWRVRRRGGRARDRRRRLLLLLLRPDPLLLARRLGGGGAGPRPRRATGEAVRAVWGSPTGRLGLTSVVVSHSVMVGVMVMTPVHMGHAGGPEGATLRVIGLVISVHVAGMYLFSPLVGLLADRAGRTATVAIGGCCCCSPPRSPAPRRQVRPCNSAPACSCSASAGRAGSSPGSTLVTESVDADLRPTAQGGTDLLMGLGAALAGVVGGPLLAAGGFGLVAGCLRRAGPAAGRRVAARGARQRSR